MTLFALATALLLTLQDPVSAAEQAERARDAEAAVGDAAYAAETERYSRLATTVAAGDAGEAPEVGANGEPLVAASDVAYEAAVEADVDAILAAPPSVRRELVRRLIEDRRFACRQASSGRETLTESGMIETNDPVALTDLWLSFVQNRTCLRPASDW